MSTIEILEQFGLIRRQINRLGILNLSQFKFKLGPKQMILLKFVYKKNQCTMTEIAEGTGSDKASVTRMVSALVKANYLQRIQSQTDQRESLVQLGVQTKKIIPQIEKIYCKLSEDFAGCLTKQEQNQLMEILKKIETSLNQAIEQGV